MRNANPVNRGLVVAIGLAAALAGACVPSDSEPTAESGDASLASAEEGATFLLEGARLILGDGGMIEDGALLIAGDRILEVGATGEISSPPGATSIDLSGKTVIPALIDAHAHLGYEGYTSWGAENYSRENLIEHLERYAYYGFGAVFSAGSDPDDLAIELQRDQQAGEVAGARFLFGAGMAPPGQGPNNQFLGHALAIADQTGMTVLRGVASEEEGRAAVREVAAKEIPFIKIWVDDRGGSQEKLGRAAYRAIIDEARTHGIEVIVHQQSAQDMPDLLEAGVAGFLHGRLGPGLDDDVAAQIHESGAFLVPNLGLGELRREPVGDDPFLQEATLPEVATRLREAYDARQQTGGGQQGAAAGVTERERELSESFSRLVAADVDIVLGTDAGAVPDHFFGYTGHRELEIFVRLGMTPMQAIVAATSRPAEQLGLGEMGTLAPGKSADFVILDANPLEDIRNTRTISRVYLRGREVDREGLGGRWTGRD
jgi:imidazolonepropionase-like amidohydrolase